MRALIAGLGAIGQRHARNLRALRPDVELIAYRQRRLRHVVTPALTRDDAQDVEGALGVTAFDDLDAALATKPDVTLICTPTSQHLPIALAAAAAGSHLFIEKPVSNTIDGIGRLRRLVSEQKLVALVGCQWRFHPLVERLQAMLAARAFGALQKATITYAEYLPDWHPYEDYRTSYAARADLGGGVVLTHIHDYDLAWHLFGAVTGVLATGGHLSDLEIDVEDTAHATLDTVSGPVVVSQTFASRHVTRRIDVTGSAGACTLDLQGCTLHATGQVAEEVALPEYQRNAMFVAELAHFLACVETGSAPRIPLDDGIAVLQVALAVKASLARGTFVSLT
jgi:predicted dehydrogenase